MIAEPPIPPTDPEEAVLMRLATLPPPSVHSLAFNNRRDVLGEEAAAMQVHAAAADLRHAIRVRIARAARRLRREFRHEG